MNVARTRFAPSPTGYLHIGSLRTVLFAYLISKSLNGKLILRIEDTDQKRYVDGAVEKLIAILNWVGLKFDEGPHVGGDFGPYIQSQRQAIYKKYIDMLLEKGEVYYCFCTEERLKDMRDKQAENKLPPRYDRHCRDLNKIEIEKKLNAKEPYVIRQKMPLSGAVKVYDELRGEIIFQAEDLEDHILIKSDGMPTYHFALVVDDHLMEITHVLRGEEWIPSFPKNILLYDSFGWTPPKFIHMPLTLNKTGGKLSKRQGDVAVEDYKDKGYLPEALINYSALLGWHPKNEKEIFTLDELEQEFKIDDMGISPAVFDIEKLDYLNGYYIRKKDLSQLANLVLPFLLKSGIIESVSDEKFKIKDSGEIVDMEFIMKVAGLEQERLKKLSDLPVLTEFIFADKLIYNDLLLIWKNMELKEAKENLKELLEFCENMAVDGWNKKDLEEKIIKFIKDKNGKIGEYLWPMRVALTGMQASPGPFEVAEVLGKAKTLARIKEALE